MMTGGLLAVTPMAIVNVFCKGAPYIQPSTGSLRWNQIKRRCAAANKHAETTVVASLCRFFFFACGQAYWLPLPTTNGVRRDNLQAASKKAGDSCLGKLRRQESLDFSRRQIGKQDLEGKSHAPTKNSTPAAECASNPTYCVALSVGLSGRH